MNADEPQGCTTDALLWRMDQSHAVSVAASHDLLRAVAAYEGTGAWRADGALSMEAWLAYRYALDLRTAREIVRVARALEELPALAAAYAHACLSYDQLRHLTWIATPADDARWAERGPGMDASALERAARRARRLREQQALLREREAQIHSGPEGHDPTSSSPDAQDHDPTSSSPDAPDHDPTSGSPASDSRGRLRTWWTNDRRTLRISGRLPAADGAIVETALLRLANQAPADPVTGDLQPFEVRCADALVQMAGTRLSADPDHERATVVVHTDLDTLTGNGVGELQNGVVVGADTVKRLACDARVQLIVHDGEGIPIGAGRASRIPSPALRREVLHRDQGCVWPGCPHRYWVDVHHITPWSEGGETHARNLASICPLHHTLCHECGWRITGDPYTGLYFHRPDGSVLGTGPPPLDRDVRERFWSPEGAPGGRNNDEEPEPPPAARPP